MQKIQATSPQAQSADLVQANIEQLKQLFPELLTESAHGVAVNVDVLKALVGDQTATDADEKYGLNWHGKRRARQLALTPSTGTLRPCPDESVDWDTTQNLMIEGDNLEVLKLLQKSYANKVKLIYIDPPYNTGKDFVYPDNFQDNIKNYLEITGQSAGGAKVSSNTEASGRFHTDWLNMMYPRLKLAKNLLRDDGVMFVSIDDSECSSLRIMMDEIFGAENFAASIAWKKRSSPDARDTIGSIHDAVLCYVKNEEKIKLAIGKMPLSENRVEAYSNPDGDERGNWASVDMTGMTGRATKEQYFNIELPCGKIIGPPEGRSWGLAEQTFLALRADNRIWFGKNGDGVPRVKKFLSESDGQVIPSLWDMSEVGSNEEAKKEVNALMQLADVFDTPKPTRLIRRMIQVASTKSDESIVVDFFSGSGTCGHAVNLQNAEDGGNRRYLLVQLPEPLNSENKLQKTAADFCDQLGKPRTIAELTKERLRRAATKIRATTASQTGATGQLGLEETFQPPAPAPDLGFRVFKLDHSNIRAWNPQPADLEQAVIDYQDHLLAGRSESDILYELLLKLGLDLCVPIATRQLAGLDVYAVGGGVLLACLAPAITSADVEALAGGIIAWHQELAPAGDCTCVFRDSAFEDDVAKTNLTAILAQSGIENVRSL